MRIVVFGPPGVGKGTQAGLLSKHRGLKHISTGDMVRAAIKAGTAIGEEARTYVDAGQLVPGRVIGQLAETAIADQGFDDFILDGYPRTAEQARWLKAFLARHNAPLHAVIHLRVPVAVIINRLSKRRIHKVTGATYHLDVDPPPPDVDRGLITQREDDRPAAIRRRLNVYQQETAPVLAYYGNTPGYFEVDGQGTFAEVNARIEDVLRQVGPEAQLALR